MSIARSSAIASDRLNWVCSQGARASSAPAPPIAAAKAPTNVMPT